VGKCESVKVGKCESVKVGKCESVKVGKCSCEEGDGAVRRKFEGIKVKVTGFRLGGRNDERAIKVKIKIKFKNMNKIIST